MSRETHGAPLVRCLTVWSLTTTTALVVLRGLGPELDAARATANPLAERGVPFDSLLVGAAAVALCACTLWLWTVTTLVVVQATTGRLRSLRACPDGVRRLVLAACGLALVATAAPAAADSTAGRPPAPDDRHAVSGLPLPDRVALGPPASRPPATSPVGISPAGSERRRLHLVTQGETLWEIAEASLSGPASDLDIDRRWRDIWAANRAMVGPDPDLIHPGTTLRLPPAKES